MSSRLGPRRSPAEDLRRTGRPRDEHRRVAGSTGADGVRHGPTGGRLGRREHLADREAAAVAQVERERLVRARIAGRGGLEGEEMGLREVGDVDVVADARPVRGRVVVAEDGQRRAAVDRAQDVRDQVGLGVVDLADACRSRRRR